MQPPCVGERRQGVGASAREDAEISVDALGLRCQVYQDAF